MNDLENILDLLSKSMWSTPMLLFFLVSGGIFTLRFRGIQLRGLGQGLRSIFCKDREEGMSAYSALCTALGATIGTGNIVGVATAISAGGPGAVFWMLIAGFLGMATQFAEGFLAVRYGKNPPPSSAVVGPFSYMELGLGKRWMGKLYAGITLAAGLLGVGTVTQISSITQAIDGMFPAPPMWLGLSLPVVLATALICLCAAAVIFGGAKRIGTVCQTLVPLMSGLFLLCSVLLLFRHRGGIPSALGLILKGAFSPKAIMGAGAGIGLRQVMRMGISRGVLTNEAGMGTAAIAAGASNVTDPMRQGLISMSATFIDTLVICSISGLCLVVTGAWRMPLEGGALTAFAWTVGLPWKGEISVFLLNMSLVFFAFATVIGWCFYAERCLIYLTGGKGLKLYRLGYILVLSVGAFLSVDGAFYLADILNGAMALPNLISLLLLQEEVVKEVRNNY